MFLAVISQSTRFSDADAATATTACAAQLRLHVAPLWDMVPASVVFYPDSAAVPASADLLVILDDADQAGALGYHAETPDGKPYARVFVGPVLDNGGAPLQGELTVSSVISHEVCEWFGDRFVNLWADDGSGTEYAVELCDPVEQDSYELAGAMVSNFVTKRYFDTRSPKGTQVDYLGNLDQPLSMTAGGYRLIRRAGKVRQQFGTRYPAWRRGIKEFPAARTAKLQAQGENRSSAS